MDENIDYFEFESGERIPEEILKKSRYIREITKENSKYRQIGIRESNGFEINLNIKSKEEAKEVLRLLREKIYKFKIGEDGLPLHSSGGEEITNMGAYPLADAVPCIILGKDFEKFIGESLTDFTRCQKLSLIKKGDEINSLTHRTTNRLIQHPAFLELKSGFGELLQAIPVYANNYLITKYLDI